MRPLLPEHDGAARIMAHDVEQVLAVIDPDHGDRAIGCLRHGVLLVFGAPCQLRLLAGQEHGRTIPLADLAPVTSRLSFRTILLSRAHPREHAASAAVGFERSYTTEGHHRSRGERGSPAAILTFHRSTCDYGRVLEGAAVEYIDLLWAEANLRLYSSQARKIVSRIACSFDESGPVPNVRAYIGPHDQNDDRVRAHFR